MQAERTSLLGLALAATIALAGIALRARGGSVTPNIPGDDDAVALAHEIDDMREARARLDSLLLEIEQLDEDIDAARTSAHVRLEELLRERESFMKRLSAARALADRADLVKCVCVPRQCIDNPLAKECW